MKKIRPYLWRGGALVLAAALVVLLVLSGMGLSTQEPEPLPPPPAPPIRPAGPGGAGGPGALCPPPAGRQDKRKAPPQGSFFDAVGKNYFFSMTVIRPWP